MDHRIHDPSANQLNLLHPKRPRMMNPQGRKAMVRESGGILGC
jgi:hypothetical protein